MKESVIRKKFEAVRVHARWRWKTMVANVRRERLRRQIERARGPLIFRFHSPNNGMFAHLTWCLHVAAWAERHGKRYQVACTSVNYGEPSGRLDWFARLLEHQKPPGSEGSPTHLVIHEYEDLPFFTEETSFTLESARELFRESFRVAPALAERVSELKARLFDGRLTVGLHYRGTDKQIEADRVSYEDALETARRTLTAVETVVGSRPVLFLATDETAMVQFAPQFMHPFEVVSVESVVRSTDGNPIHLDRGSDRSRFATEAMIDALLLGECDALIKTASMLSGWSVIMSPKKPVMLLNPPRSGSLFFPDYLLVENAYKSGEEVAMVAEMTRPRTDPDLNRASLAV